ncbi:MBG domain-containing protein, partial [Salinimicrobium oceani]
MREFLLKFTGATRFVLLLMMLTLPATTVVGQTNFVADSLGYAKEGMPNPTVTSDKEDYSPGETAIISGTGWTLDSIVDIHIEEEPTHLHHHGYHGTRVNDDGTWRIEYPITEDHLGVTFTVTVDGLTSKYQGEHTFTDGSWIININHEICLGQTKNLQFLVKQVNSGGGNNNSYRISFPNSFSLSNPAIVNATQQGNWVISLSGKDICLNSLNPDRTKNQDEIRFSVNVTPSESNTYSLSGIASTINGSCPTSSSPGSIRQQSTASIFVLPSPEAPEASSNAPILAGETLDLFASTVPGASYSWTGPNGFLSSDQNPSISNVSSAAAGTYSVTATVGGCTSEAGTVSVVVNTISPASLSVAPATGTYGGSTNLSATLTSNSTGVSGKTISFSLNGNGVGTAVTDRSGIATVSNVSLSGIDAASYASGISATFSGDATHSGSSGSGDLIINQRPITITANAGQTKVYGEDDPAAFAYTVSGDGLAPDDSFDGALDRDGGEVVGDYAIKTGTLTIVEGATNKEDNYTVTYVSADFAITAKTLEVVATAGQSKIYGAADPVYAYTATGFEFSDDESILTGALDRAAGETVAGSPYAIGVGNLSAGTNYSIDFTSADFAITAKTLEVVATAGQSKIYGAADPVYAYTATGFEFSDDESILTGA